MDFEGYDALTLSEEEKESLKTILKKILDQRNEAEKE